MGGGIERYLVYAEGQDTRPRDTKLRIEDGWLGVRGYVRDSERIRRRLGKSHRLEDDAVWHGAL